MILLVGGSGILGQELKNYFPFYSPMRNEFDITDKRFWIIPNPCELIVHIAAYTNVLKAETEKELCYQTNVIGTRNLASLGIPMLYISTEYVFDGEKGNYEENDYPNPQNFYALTKLLGEYEARRTRSVVVRCLFKSRPFKHDRACTDQWTSGDYVDIMGKEISLVIRLLDKCPETLHIGFEKKSTFELAKRSKPDIQPCVRTGLSVRLPRDTSLNFSKWEEIKNEFIKENEH